MAAYEVCGSQKSTYRKQLSCPKCVKSRRMWVRSDCSSLYPQCQEHSKCSGSILYSKWGEDTAAADQRIKIRKYVYL